MCKEMEDEVNPIIMVRNAWQFEDTNRPISVYPFIIKKLKNIIQNVNLFRISTKDIYPAKIMNRTVML